MKFQALIENIETYALRGEKGYYVTFKHIVPLCLGSKDICSTPCDFKNKYTQNALHNLKNQLRGVVSVSQIKCESVIYDNIQNKT